MPFSALLISLDALYRHRINDKQLLVRFSELIKRVESCSAKRNRIIHSSWGILNEGANGLYLMRYKTKNKLGKGKITDSEKATPDLVVSLIELTESLSEEIIAIFFDTLKHNVLKGIKPDKRETYI